VKDSQAIPLAARVRKATDQKAPSNLTPIPKRWDSSRTGFGLRADVLFHSHRRDAFFGAAAS
jgi:hypothetical protein